ncbi:MAG: MMPL family transporter [Acidimicrobiales bacterium]
MLAAWFVLLIGVYAWGGAIGGSKADGSLEIPKSDSRSGLDVLQKSFPGSGGGLTGSIVYQTTGSVNDEAIKAPMNKLFARMEKISGVSVASPYELPAGPTQISEDGRTAYATVNLSPKINQTEAGKIGERIKAMLPSVKGTRLEVGGAALSKFEPPSSEMVGVAFAIVVLILAFGSVLAMGLPIAVALGGVGVGAGIIALVSHVTSVPEFATTIGAMIGLGVGIDYALFIVTRYREGLHEGLEPRDATVVALDTAGRAVIFAGMTVVISLLGMLLIQLKFISGLGIGAAVTVAVTMLASVTLLPALLGLAGPRVEVTRWRGLIAAGLVAVALLGVGLKVPALALVAAPLAVVVFALGFALAPLKAQVRPRARKPSNETFAYRWSHAIQARPWTSVLIGAIVLVGLALPLFSLNLGSSDDGNFPKDTDTRQAYDLLADGFGPGFNGPLIVTATFRGTPAQKPLMDLAAALGKAPGVAKVVGPIPNNFTDPTKADAFLFRVIPSTSPQDNRTQRLIDDLRSDTIPSVTKGTALDAHVTGNVAVFHDFTSYLSDRMPLFIGVVLALSFLLLMAVFRSLLVPLKAVVMNMLSIGAAYGIIVAIFQWGWLGSLFGIAGGPIEPFLPMMMFAIVFGLSMDYEVFLLSRVKEEYDRTGDAKNSVADGLAATARVITAAAAIMVVVFGSFMFEDNRITKMFGLGLAVAVLLDASLVRMLLVPATMELLGEKNWWIPKWLDRLLPKINVEGPADHHIGGGVGDPYDLDAEAAGLDAGESLPV